MSDRTPVIVGIGLSDYPVAPHLSEREHHAQALQRALADCGIPKRDIIVVTHFSLGAGALSSLTSHAPL